jgi:hypothetical protein
MEKVHALLASLIFWSLPFLKIRTTFGCKVWRTNQCLQHGFLFDSFNLKFINFRGFTNYDNFVTVFLHS